MIPGKNLGIDLGTSGGDWLFRQGELVLGPVPAVQIVERLYRGELDGKTEVALLGNSDFQNISSVDFFKIHLAKAEAKLRVDAAAQRERARTQRRRAIKITGVVATAVVVAAVCAFVARYLAVHASLPTATEDEALFEIEPPVIRLAKSRVTDEELVDYQSPAAQKAAAIANAFAAKPPADPPAAAAPAAGPGATGAAGAGAVASGAAAEPKAPAAGAKPEKPARLASAAGAAAKPARNGSGPRMSEAKDDPDGLQTAEFDQEAINAVVAQKQKTLYPCLKAEVARRPTLAGKVPIEFVIGSDGKVNKLWIDHPDLKTGPMHECMLKELQKWPFKPYDGESATVALAFKVNSKAK